MICGQRGNNIGSGPDYQNVPDREACVVKCLAEGPSCGGFFFSIPDQVCDTLSGEARKVDQPALAAVIGDGAEFATA